MHGQLHVRDCVLLAPDSAFPYPIGFFSFLF